MGKVCDEGKWGDCECGRGRAAGWGDGGILHKEKERYSRLKTTAALLPGKGAAAQLRRATDAGTEHRLTLLEFQGSAPAAHSSSGLGGPLEGAEQKRDLIRLRGLALGTDADANERAALHRGNTMLSS